MSARWVERIPKDEQEPASVEAGALERALELHPLTAKLLLSRGVKSIEEARSFLEPTLRELPAPTLMKGMDLACVRITEAIEKGEQIVIYGDYDVDGVTSTSILYLFLLRLGVPEENLHFFIPHRVTHGYGLQMSCLPLVKDLGCDLMITVDCGITSRDEVQAASALGIETIIIDHHLVPPLMPEAVAILNPHQEDCNYPDKSLAAVGVTFNLMIGLRAHLRAQGFFDGQKEPNLREYLDFVALGTVADVVPLKGVNRILVRVGLRQMRRTNWTGLQALIEIASLNPKTLRAGQIGFQLGPRINAVGRMKEAAIGVRLLCCHDPVEAFHMAKELDQQNQQRREREKRIFNEARGMLLSDPVLLEQRAIVLAKQGWHAGVIGIVASRLVEEFHRPTVLIALNGESGKGSCRSIRGFHIHSALQECAQHLAGFGGHAAAAGLTIEAEKVDAFRDAFCRNADTMLAPDDLTPEVSFDVEFDPSELSEPLLYELERLEPHGMGNPAPLLVAKDIAVSDQRIVGKDHNHLQLRVRSSSGQVLKGIAFGKHEQYPLPRQVTLAYRPSFNDWRGRRSIQLEVKQIQTKDS